MGAWLSWEWPRKPKTPEPLPQCTAADADSKAGIIHVYVDGRDDVDPRQSRWYGRLPTETPMLTSLTFDRSLTEADHEYRLHMTSLKKACAIILERTGELTQMLCHYDAYTDTFTHATDFAKAHSRSMRESHFDIQVYSKHEMFILTLYLCWILVNVYSWPETIGVTYTYTLAGGACITIASDPERHWRRCVPSLVEPFIIRRALADELGQEFPVHGATLQSLAALAVVRAGIDPASLPSDIAEYVGRWYGSGN